MHFLADRGNGCSLASQPRLCRTTTQLCSIPYASFDRESARSRTSPQVQKTAELQTLEEERSAQVERAQRDLDEAKAAHAESEAKMSARVEELTKKFKMARKALKESKDGAANMQEQVRSIRGHENGSA